MNDKDLPLIEVEEILPKPKTQWEKQLEQSVNQVGKQNTFSDKIKPEEEVKTIDPWRGRR